VILHSLSFVILSVNFIIIIHLRHLFTNICNLLVIWLVVFQVSQAYSNTDFTFVLNVRILTLFYVPYIVESNPYPFYSFRGLKNEMQIRIACGLDSRSRAGFGKMIEPLYVP
jgi:hypothetical protein